MQPQPAKTMNLFGRELTANQLSNLLMVLACVIAVLSLVGLEMVALGLMVSAAVGIMYWALRLQDLSQTPAQRFAELRRLARRRRDSDTENDGCQQIPGWVLGVAGCVILIVCGNNLFKLQRQYSSSQYPIALGTMTRYETVDVGLTGSQLETEYEYTVGGVLYRGEQKRFAFRPYRVGTDQAKLLVANWGQGNRIPVFYDPDNPAMAAIDNTFCKGDRLFVGFNVLAVLGVLIAAACFAGARWRQVLFTSQRQVEWDASRNRIVIPLSNLPLFGMLGLALTAISFCTLLGLLFVSLWVMASVEIPWLISAIDWLYLISFGLLAGSSICYLVERFSYGKEGRQCEIDRSRELITIQPQGFNDSVTIRFQDIISFELVSNRDDWYRLRRTFSPTFDYRAQDGRDCRIVLQRDTNRNRGVKLFATIKQFLAESAIRDDWCDGRSTLVPDLTNV